MLKEFYKINKKTINISIVLFLIVLVGAVVNEYYYNFNKTLLGVFFVPFVMLSIILGQKFAIHLFTFNVEQKSKAKTDS